MILHTTPFFRIYFGNAGDCLFPDQYLRLSNEKNILERQPFLQLKKNLPLKHLFFLKQIHSSKGLVIKESELDSLFSFSYEGDFLVSNISQVGLGVMTADCLPVIFFDKRQMAIAVVHAGWRGAVKNILLKTLQLMNQTYHSQTKDLQIFFGPSAKICCYEVSKDFNAHLESYSFANQTLVQHNNKHYFDLPRFCLLQLESLGINDSSIHLDYNICTICNKNLCSKRGRNKLGRQMTVVSLL